MFKLLSRIGLLETALVLGLISLSVALANEYRNRAILYSELAQSQLRQAQVELALRTEANRAAKLEHVLAGKTREMSELISRLMTTTEQLASFQNKVKTRDEQISRLQTEITLARRDAPEAPAPLAASEDAARVELDKIAVAMPRATSPAGRVLQVNAEWGFIVVDLGWNTAGLGQQLDIYRDNQLIAQAQVERLQENALAARVLPPYQTASIQLQDAVFAPEVNP